MAVGTHVHGHRRRAQRHRCSGVGANPCRFRAAQAGLARPAAATDATLHAGRALGADLRHRAARREVLMAWLARALAPLRRPWAALAVSAILSFVSLAALNAPPQPAEAATQAQAGARKGVGRAGHAPEM